MSKLGGTMEEIVDDLRHSWYFRIWFFTWFFCALMVFVAMIILGEKSTQSHDDKTWLLHVDEGDKLEYPKEMSFSMVFLPEYYPTIHSCECTFANGEFAVVESCEDNCWMVGTGAFEASAEYNSLLCQLNITAIPSQGINAPLNVGIEEGGDSTTRFFAINPTMAATVELIKAKKKAYGEDSIYEWQANVFYLHPVATGSYMSVYIKFGSFDIYEYEEQIVYDRWMSVGDIGGFAFFMYILHTMLMILVGLCFENNSKFVGPHSSSTSTSSTTTEPDRRAYDKL